MKIIFFCNAEKINCSPVPCNTITYSFLSENDTPQQLIFKTLHRHSEVNNWRPGENFRCVSWVSKFCCDVQHKSFHHVTLFVTDLHLQGGADLDEVFLKNTVKGGVEFLGDVFNDERSPKRHGVLEVLTEIFVVQGCQLWWKSISCLFCKMGRSIFQYKGVWNNWACLRHRLNCFTKAQISAIIVHCVDSILLTLAKSKISRL